MNFKTNNYESISSLTDFEIITELGKGSFGSVYKVLRKTDDRIYAMKKVALSKLNLKERENALNEIRLLASIGNPNIIEYKDAFYDSLSNSLCLVMEYAECGDLEKKIAKKSKDKESFSELEIISIFTQIIKGLKALHNAKVIHRDMKAANIFIFNRNIIKIGDLNVSKSIKMAFKHTQTGTPYYASPEVWDNLPYDYKSDIWSVGCLLYEMCTLHAPFRGTSIKMVYDKVKKCQYDPIPKYFSKMISDLVYICLQANPVNRPSCKKLLTLIRDESSRFNSNRIMIYSPHCKRMDNKLTLGRNVMADLRASRSQNNEERENSSSNVLLKTIKMPKNLYQINNILPKNHYATRRIKSAFKTIIKFPNIFKNSNKNSNKNKNNYNKSNINPLLQNNYSDVNVNGNANYEVISESKESKYCLIYPRKNTDNNNECILKGEMQSSSHNTSVNNRDINKTKIRDLIKEDSNELLESLEQNNSFENKIPYIKKQQKTISEPNIRPINNSVLMRKKILKKQINDSYNTIDTNNISVNNKTEDPRRLLSELHKDITQVEEILNNIHKAFPQDSSSKRNYQHQHQHHHHIKKNYSQLNVKYLCGLNQKESITNSNDISINNARNHSCLNKKTNSFEINSFNNKQINNNKLSLQEMRLYSNNNNSNNNQLPTIERSKFFPTTPSIKTNDQSIYSHSKQITSYNEHSVDKKDGKSNKFQQQNLLISKLKPENTPIKLCKLPYKNHINFESNITVAQDVNKIIKGFKIINNY